MRKQLIAIAAGVALGVATMATAAIAAPHGGGGGGHFGGGGGGHFGGGGHPAFGGVHSFAAPQAHAGVNFAANNWHGNGGNWHGNGNWRGYRGGYYGPAIGAYALGAYALGGYGPDYYDYSDSPDYAYSGSDGCYQQQLVQTAYGAQWQLVDVCQ